MTSEMLSPVYEIDGKWKLTETGEEVTQEKADEILLAWQKDLTPEEIYCAERETEYMVKTGSLK